MKEIPYDRWREYDPEDTVRFYALRLHEAGHDQVESAEDHRPGHRLALPQRAEEGAEGLRRIAAGCGAPRRARCSQERRPLRTSPAVTRGCPTIGTAPAFTLTTTEGAELALTDLRGKVVAVTFIYATCTDTCPLLTTKLVGLRQRLGKDDGQRWRSSRSRWIPSATRRRCCVTTRRRTGRTARASRSSPARRGRSRR